MNILDTVLIVSAVVAIFLTQQSGHNDETQS